MRPKLIKPFMPSNRNIAFSDEMLRHHHPPLPCKFSEYQVPFFLILSAWIPCRRGLGGARGEAVFRDAVKTIMGFAGEPINKPFTLLGRGDGWPSKQSPTKVRLAHEKHDANKVAEEVQTNGEHISYKLHKTRAGAPTRRCLMARWRPPKERSKPEAIGSVVLWFQNFLGRPETLASGLRPCALTLQLSSKHLRSPKSLQGHENAAARNGAVGTSGLRAGPGVSGRPKLFELKSQIIGPMDQEKEAWILARGPTHNDAKQKLKKANPDPRPCTFSNRNIPLQDSTSLGSSSVK